MHYKVLTFVFGVLFLVMCMEVVWIQSSADSAMFQDKQTIRDLRVEINKADRDYQTLCNESAKAQGDMQTQIDKLIRQNIMFSSLNGSLRPIEYRTIYIPVAPYRMFQCTNYYHYCR